MLPYDPSLSMVVLAASLTRRDPQRRRPEWDDERLDREPELEDAPRPARPQRSRLTFPRRLLARALSRS